MVPYEINEMIKTLKFTTHSRRYRRWRHFRFKSAKQFLNTKKMGVCNVTGIKVAMQSLLKGSVLTKHTYRVRELGRSESCLAWRKLEGYSYSITKSKDWLHDRGKKNRIYYICSYLWIQSTKISILKFIANSTFILLFIVYT